MSGSCTDTMPVLRRTYDQSFPERAQHQRNRLHHCLTVVSRRWIHLGKIQGAPPQIWEKSGGIRFLSVHSQCENFGEFSLKDFRLGMHYFLKNQDHTAARQLIFIGEQNNVRGQLEPAEQKVYAQLFEKYDGRKVVDDTNDYLENYVRLVRLIGKSFPHTGIGF